MNSSSVLTIKDLKHLKDGCKYYLDYMRQENFLREAPKMYEEVHDAYLHLIGVVSFMEKNPELGNAIQLTRKDWLREF